MSEQLPEYTDLSKEDRLAVINTLAATALKLIARHPDIQFRAVEEALHPQPYGNFVWLALQRLIKEGRVVQNDACNHATLRLPERDD